MTRVPFAAVLVLLASGGAGAQPISNLELFTVRSPSLDDSGLGGARSMAVVPDLDGDGRGELALGLSVGTFDEADLVFVVSGDVTRAEVEPNDNREEAQRLRGQSPVVIEGLGHGSDIGFGGQVFVGEREKVEDLYRIDLLSPGLRATLDGLSDDLDLYLWEPDLTLVDVSGAGGSAAEVIDLPDLPAGTYYIGVDFYGERGDINSEGEWSTYTLTVEGALEPSVAAEVGPAAVELGPPRPNPFSGQAQVDVTLAVAGHAQLSLVDVLGREVARIHSGLLAAGTTPLTVDGAGLAAGVYVLRLETDAGVVTRRLTHAR